MLVIRGLFITERGGFNMRKIIRLHSIVGMLLILVFSLGSEVYANPFDNDPNYFKYGEDEKRSSYVDLSSISCTRYDPPYYAMSALDIDWYYSDNTYTKSKAIILYNYNTKKVILNYNGVSCYSSDGSLIFNSDKPYSFEVSPNTVGATIADVVFYKYYNQFFY